MFLYDPVGPTVYYSEHAGIAVELTATSTKLKFRADGHLKQDKPNHILVDLRSVLLGDGREEMASAFEDRVTGRSTREFEVVRNFKSKPYIILNVNLTKECPYTAAAIAYDGKIYLRLDWIVLNGETGEEPFAFPGRSRLPQGLPVEEVIGDLKLGEIADREKVLGRASAVRSVVNKTSPIGPTYIPGLDEVDWDRVRENDKKYAKIFRDLVPPSLRAAPSAKPHS